MAEAMPYKAALVRKKIAGLIPQKGGHMTQAKSIKASVGFRKLSAGDILARANAILDGVYTAKDDYANPPVDQATLKTQIDALSAGITAALDGGKKAVARRKHLKEVVMTLCRGELQRRHADVPEEWLPAHFHSTYSSSAVVGIDPQDRAGQEQRSNGSHARVPAGCARLSIALGGCRFGCNTGQLDRATGRQREITSIGNRVVPRHGLRFSGPCRHQRRLHRLE